MPEISLSNIHKYYGANHVLKGLSLEVAEGAKIGIVGGNGSGKTTLFRVLSGQEPFEHDKGSRHIARGRRMGVLDQMPVYPPGTTVREVLLASFSELLDIQSRMEDLAGQMADSEAAMNRYGTLQAAFEARGGYGMETRIGRVAQGLDIPESMQRQPFASLSGGEKTRVSLAAIVLRETDILLLDEPTNHLDIPSVEWLEDFLETYRGTVLIISHDRYFLDQVATNIFEVVDGKGELYPGNYSAYAELKERRRIEQLARYETEQKKIRQLEAAAKRLHDWANRADNPKFHRQAFNIEKRVARMERDGTEKPKTEKAVKARFAGEAYRGDGVLTVSGLSKRFGARQVLDDLSFKLFGGDRMVLLGSNGSGKTTLLRILMGEMEPDAGQVRVTESIRVGYLPQEVVFEVPERTVMDTLRYAHPMDEGRARNLLAAYRFTGEDVFKKVSGLSGGEKSRLKLCLLMQESVNLLVLDEPTNHLDLPAREWVEESLEEFPGSILFVSHDRYFVRRFANRVAELSDGKVETWPFDYPQWLAWRMWKQDQEKQAAVTVPAPSGQDALEEAPGRSSEAALSRQAAKERNRQLSMTRRAVEQAEAQIEAAEKRLASLDAEMAASATDYVALQALSAEKEALVRKLPALYDGWEQGQEVLQTLMEADDPPAGR